MEPSNHYTWKNIVFLLKIENKYQKKLYFICTKTRLMLFWSVKTTGTE